MRVGYQKTVRLANDSPAYNNNNVVLSEHSYCAKEHQTPRCRLPSAVSQGLWCRVGLLE